MVKLILGMEQYTPGTERKQTTYTIKTLMDDISHYITQSNHWSSTSMTFFNGQEHKKKKKKKTGVKVSHKRSNKRDKISPLKFVTVAIK